MIKKSKNKNAISVSRIWPVVFLAPYFIFYIVFGLFPMLYSFYLSLTDWDGLTKMTFVGFSNYVNLFSDSMFWKSIANTFIISSVTPIHIIIVLIVSVMLHSKLCKFRSTAQTIMFLPYVTAIIALGVIFLQLFQWKNGVVNLLLMRLSIIDKHINWLGNPWLARLVTTFVIQWRFMGYSCVIVMAGLSNIPNDYYEAAQIDGANAVQRFVKITLPQLRPILLFMAITSISGNMQLFEIPLTLFSSGNGILAGGPRQSVLTAIWYMYDTAFNRTTRYGYASAITFAVFIIMVGLSILSFLIARRGDKNE